MPFLLFSWVFFFFFSKCYDEYIQTSEYLNTKYIFVEKWAFGECFYLAMMWICILYHFFFYLSKFLLYQREYESWLFASFASICAWFALGCEPHLTKSHFFFLKKKYSCVCVLCMWNGQVLFPIQAKLHSRAFDDLYFECLFVFFSEFYVVGYVNYIWHVKSQAYRKLEILNWIFHTMKYEKWIFGHFEWQNQEVKCGS